MSKGRLMAELLSPDFWLRRDVKSMGAQLREELDSPEKCDQLLHHWCFEAGQGLRHYEDLMQWARAEGDEKALWEAGRHFDDWFRATDAILGHRKQCNARLEAEAQQRANE